MRVHYTRPMQRGKSTNENRSLNVIRSASALLVVLGHVRLLFFQNYPDAPHNPLNAFLYATTSLGSEAVIVFFVLSGYFVGGSVIFKQSRGIFAWPEYASARVTRLALVLVPALALTFAADRIGAALRPTAEIYTRPDLYGGMQSDPSHSWVTLIGNLGFVQGLYVQPFGTNNPLWSLAFEFWYYLMFPALLLAIRSGTWKSRALNGLVLVVGAVISGPTILVLFPAWIVGAIVGGNRAAISAWIIRIGSTRTGFLRVVAIVLTLGVMVVARESNLPPTIGFLSVAIVAAVLVSSFVTDVNWVGLPGRILSGLSWSAHFSYSFYAIHMPLVVLLCAFVIPNNEDRWQMSPASIAAALLIIAMIGFIAWGFAALTEARTDQVRSWVRKSLLTREKASRQDAAL